MVIIKGKFERFKPLTVKTNLIFSTKDEIDPLVLEQVAGTEGFISFSGDTLKKSVEDAMKDRSIGVNMDGKSPSQVLRGVLWQIAEQQEEGSGDFFYNDEMRKIIDHYRKKYLS